MTGVSLLDEGAERRRGLDRDLHVGAGRDHRVDRGSRRGVVHVHVGGDQPDRRRRRRAGVRHPRSHDRHDAEDRDRHGGGNHEDLAPRHGDAHEDHQCRRSPRAAGRRRRPRRGRPVRAARTTPRGAPRRRRRSPIGEAGVRTSTERTGRARIPRGPLWDAVPRHGRPRLPHREQRAPLRRRVRGVLLDGSAVLLGLAGVLREAAVGDRRRGPRGRRARRRHRGRAAGRRRVVATRRPLRPARDPHGAHGVEQRVRVVDPARRGALRRPDGRRRRRRAGRAGAPGPRPPRDPREGLPRGSVGCDPDRARRRSLRSRIRARPPWLATGIRGRSASCTSTPTPTPAPSSGARSSATARRCAA